MKVEGWGLEVEGWRVKVEDFGFETFPYRCTTRWVRKIFKDGFLKNVIFCLFWRETNKRVSENHYLRILRHSNHEIRKFCKIFHHFAASNRNVGKNWYPSMFFNEAMWFSYTWWHVLYFSCLIVFVNWKHFVVFFITCFCFLISGEGVCKGRNTFFEKLYLKIRY